VPAALRRRNPAGSTDRTRPRGPRGALAQRVMLVGSGARWTHRSKCAKPRLASGHRHHRQATAKSQAGVPRGATPRTSAVTRPRWHRRASRPSLDRSSLHASRPIEHRIMIGTAEHALGGAARQCAHRCQAETKRIVNLSNARRPNAKARVSFIDGIYLAVELFDEPSPDLGDDGA